MAFLVNLFFFLHQSKRHHGKTKRRFFVVLAPVLARPALPVERAQFPNGNDDISSNFVADAVCSRIEMLEGV